MKEGEEVMVFKGREGEWKERIKKEGRKRIIIEKLEKKRNKKKKREIIYWFEKMKKGRID